MDVFYSCEINFRYRKEPMFITFTAETHNFPTAVCPFEGASTGTGGRIRDTQAIGRGGFFVAGTCGYCVGEIEAGTLNCHAKNRWTPVQTLLQARLVIYS